VSRPLGEQQNQFGGVSRQRTRARRTQESERRFRRSRLESRNVQVVCRRGGNAFGPRTDRRGSGAGQRAGGRVGNPRSGGWEARRLPAGPLEDGGGRRRLASFRKGGAGPGFSSPEVELGTRGFSRRRGACQRAGRRMAWHRRADGGGASRRPPQTDHGLPRSSSAAPRSACDAHSGFRALKRSLAASDRRCAPATATRSGGSPPGTRPGAGTV